MGRFSHVWKRLLACNACGIKLQNTENTKEGYFIVPKEAKGKKLQSLEDVKYLLFSQDLQKAKGLVEAGTFEGLRRTRSPESLICKRCSDAIHKNEYKLEDFRGFAYGEISRYIPSGSNVLHLVSLPEFPLGLSRDILEEPRFDTSVLLTKADQLIKDRSTLQKKSAVFFRDFMKNQLGISTNKTIATSTVKKWNVKSVYSMLRAHNFLLGSANVGKSTLINALIKEYMGYKVKRGQAGDILIPKIPEKDMSNMQEILRAQFAGVSHIPNMTRRRQEYKIGDKIVNDLPGFTEETAVIQYEDIIRREWLDRIRKTNLFKARKLKKKTFYSILGSENGACYTLGGLFFIKPPAETINQIINFIPGEEYEFKSIEKGLEVFKTCNVMQHPLEKYCGVKSAICSLDHYSRHVIPPFQGSVEIVLKDIGYFVLRTTGKYKFTGLHEIWVPHGITVCVREPLEKLIDVGFKEHSESHGNLPACPKKRPIISSTYVMSHNEENTFGRMREMYLERTMNDLSVRRHTHEEPLHIVRELHDERPNLYWHYQWY